MKHKVGESFRFGLNYTFTITEIRNGLYVGQWEDETMGCFTIDKFDNNERDFRKITKLERALQ